MVRRQAGSSPDRQGFAEAVGGQADLGRTPEAVSGALRGRLAVEGWREVGRHSYECMSTHHRQVMVKVGDFEAEVDEELAPLITELARAEIITILPCQENRPGIAWIMFDKDAQRVDGWRL